MFASKTPRDLNHDTHPWLHDHHWACSDNGGRFRFNNGIGNVFDPRPEFDHVQHNEPNPILVAFRVQGRKPADFLWRLGSPASTEVVYGVEQSRHARRVLGRLARLAAAVPA